MLIKIEVTLKDLLAALESARLYGKDHPKFAEDLGRAYTSLQEAMLEKQDFIIGIIGNEVAFENEILFELSRQIAPTIKYLKERQIERIAFSKGVSRQELEAFVLFLANFRKEAADKVRENLESLGVKNIAIGKIREGAAEEAPEKEAAGPADVLKVYESSLEKVSASLAEVLNDQAIDHLALQLVVGNLMQNMTQYHQELLKLTTLKRYDAVSYAHILNVGILSMYFASKTGFTKNDVLDIGIAALFHDIGKMYISRKILSKPESLSEEEFAQVQSHTVLGAQLLLKYVNVLGILPVVVAFEHHLKFDLSGYPKTPFQRKPHMASLLVSICDVYDALSQRRGYKLDYSPEMIFNVMLMEKGTSFEPWLLDKFFSIMGIWPIGSLVSLSDGRVAVVRSENENDNASPIVEVIYPEDKKETVDLVRTKDSLKVERYLNPWKEGKQFLGLLRGQPPQLDKS